MKKAVLVASGLVLSSLMTSGTAFAASNGPVVHTSSGQQNVWIVKDITQQANYHLIYKTYDANGNLIQTKSVTPLAGSLVEYEQVPLDQAVSQHQMYIVPSSGIALSDQLKQLHKQLFDKLNPQTTTSSTVQSSSVIQPNIAVGTATVLQGYYSAYNAVINYSVAYNRENPSGDVNVTLFKTWQSQGTGTAWQNSISWYTAANNISWSPDPQIPLSSTGSSYVSKSMDWYGPTGYQFSTTCVGNDIWGTVYEGYATLN